MEGLRCRHVRVKLQGPHRRSAASGTHAYAKPRPPARTRCADARGSLQEESAIESSCCPSLPAIAAPASPPASPVAARPQPFSLALPSYNLSPFPLLYITFLSHNSFATPPIMSTRGSKRKQDPEEEEELVELPEDDDDEEEEE